MRSACVLSRLAALLLLARQLAPEQFSGIAFAVAISEVARVIADAGVDVYSLREYGRRPDLMRENALGVLWAKIIFATLSLSVLLGLFAFLIPDLPALYFAPIAALPALQLGFNYFLNLALARRDPLHLLLPALRTYGVFFVYLAAVFVTRWHAEAVFAVLVALELVMLVTVYRRQRNADAWSEVSPRIGEGRPGLLFPIVRGALPLGVGAAIAIFYGRLDFFMVQHHMSAQDAGYYAFAARVLDPFMQLVNGWIATKGAVYANLRAAAQQQFVRSARRILGFALGLSVSACLVNALAAKPVLDLLFPSFVGSLQALVILGIALIPRTLNNTLTMLLIAAHQERFIPWVSLVNLVTLSVSLVVLVPAYGLAGAASSILLAESLNSVMQGALLSRTVVQPPLPQKSL